MENSGKASVISHIQLNTFQSVRISTLRMGRNPVTMIVPQEIPESVPTTNSIAVTLEILTSPSSNKREGHKFVTSTEEIIRPGSFDS